MEAANYITRPTETPQISTETAETVNVSAGEKKAAATAKKLIWKQAIELADEYEKRGYQLVYNERTKLCYLTIPGHIFVDGSQYATELTYVMTGKIDDFQDVPKAVGGYNAMYRAKYAKRCPQMLAYLPTEPREAENKPTTPTDEGTIKPQEKHAQPGKYRISRFGGYKIIVGDRVQGKVIAVLMSVNGHNTIEINDETAYVATMREKPLQIDKPIMQLSDAEALELIYGSIQPPQSQKRQQPTTRL